MRLILLIVFGLLAASSAMADPVGQVRVIDADTLDVGGVRVRLHGIDAPEIGQPCLADGLRMDCGQWASDQVTALFEGQCASCTQVDIDRFDRIVARCIINGEDIGAVIVEQGWAIAYRQYSLAYDLQEKRAAVTARGLWAFEMQEPAAYRSNLLPAQTVPDQSCRIKGNISTNGRIYHMPGAYGYDRTRINESNGERWFCSAAEAEAAGSRAAR